MRRQAFSLVELLVVIAILGLLLALLAPALGSVREQGRRAQCANQLRQSLIGLHTYAQAHGDVLPPFAFSSMTDLNLPVSAHWGGQPEVRFSTKPSVNLWALVDAAMLEPEVLICPSAGQAVEPDLSYFHETQRFSTYAIRMPYSWDLYRPRRPSWAGQQCLLSSYAMAAGGHQEVRGNLRTRVPLVRTDWHYRSEAMDYTVDMAGAAWLVDGFWRTPPTPPPPGQRYARHMDWWHGEAFHVGYGSGAVRLVRPGGALDAHTPDAQGIEPPRGRSGSFAEASEYVWKHFDGR